MPTFSYQILEVPVKDKVAKALLKMAARNRFVQVIERTKTTIKVVARMTTGDATALRARPNVKDKKWKKP